MYASSAATTGIQMSANGTRAAATSNGAPLQGLLYSLLVLKYLTRGTKISHSSSARGSWRCVAIAKRKCRLGAARRRRGWAADGRSEQAARRDDRGKQAARMGPHMRASCCSDDRGKQQR